MAEITGVTTREFDVLALGALNVDLIDTSRSSAEAEDTEVAATTEEIRARIAKAGLRVEPFLGGSDRVTQRSRLSGS